MIPEFSRRHSPGARVRLGWLITLLLAGFAHQAPAQDGEFSLDISLDLEPRQVECMPEPADGQKRLDLAFAAMLEGPDRAAACVAWLDEQNPEWHWEEGADALVVPFVTYLLGDGTKTGMQRHEIFVQLLDHLEKIEPGWRYQPPVRALMPEMILGHVVEDPFVANFWATTLEEMDPDWHESDTAKQVLPELYQRAFEEESDSSGPKNERPSQALKQISRTQYVRLLLATKVFDSWWKRTLWVLLAMVLLLLAVRKFHRQ